MTGTVLHYPGDLSASVLGEVKGPTVHGEYLTAIKATYDYDRAVGGRGVTTVEFAYGIRCAECRGIIDPAVFDPKTLATWIKFCVPLAHPEECPDAIPS